jgi:metal-responsive CopG/Arc/MetJ family transcriptional regulator
MLVKRTHIVIPQDLVSEIDAVVGKRGRSQFLTAAARKELRRLKTLGALEQAAGAWSDKDHPELKAGASKWISLLRQDDEKRRRS